MKPIIAPSLLGSDHANLSAGLRIAEESGCPWVHLDIMDGHFVPNLTFGPGTVAALRPHSKIFFDVHLMLDRPDLYLEAFIKAGANLVTIHTEPDVDTTATLRRIRQLGAQAGIAINPGTPVEDLLPYLQEVDLMLLMTVQPGFGGQSFRSDVLPKIAAVAKWREEAGLDFRIEVDGGVNVATGRQCLEAGADTLVAGSAFFQAADRTSFVRELVGG